MIERERVERGSNEGRPRVGSARKRSEATAPGRRPTRSGAGKGRVDKKAKPKARRPISARPIIPVILGTAWAIILVTAVNLGAALAALVVLPVGVVAAASVFKTVTGQPVGPKAQPSAAQGAPAALAWVPASGVAIAGPILMTLAALGGADAAIAATVVVALALGAATYLTLGPGLRAVTAALATLAPAVSCMSLVLARGQGSNQADALIAAVFAYDVACFIMGNSRTALGGPVGIVFGWISIAVVALFVAAIMDPPFSGNRPWIMFAMLALLAPAGVALANWLVGGQRLPALRRLDSLLLAGPVWVVAVSVVLHR